MSRIRVFVKPGCKRPEPPVEERADGAWLVRTRERAIDGQANAAVVAALAIHFDVPPRQVRIVRGERARTKLVEISGLDNP